MGNTSYNGWPVLRYRPSHIVRGPDGDVGRFASVDIAWLAHYTVWQWHRRIEPVVQFGGYRSPTLQQATNPLAGASNHTSATAWDVNWYLHPYEPRLKRFTWDDGFTNAGLRELRQILSECRAPDGDKIVRWGGDFRPDTKYLRGRRDGMHLEIARTVGYNSARVWASEVDHACRRIRGEIMGTQRALGVKVDCLWGPNTQKELDSLRRSNRNSGTSNAEVRQVQTAWRISADGKWGPVTDSWYFRNKKRFLGFRPYHLV